jgi:hypothetical protein
MDLSRFVLDGQSTQWVSVSLERTAPCSLHAGLIWRDADGGLRRLHFAWHRILVDQPYESVACAIPLIDDEEGIYVAAFFGKIARGAPKRQIPYNLKYDESVYFDAATGDIHLGSATGLSCATFVVAAFRSSGNLLVDVTNWPPASLEDIEAQKRFVALLKGDKNPERQQQGAKVEAEVGCSRIRPDHAAGACIESAYPVDHAICERNGREVVSKLDGKQPNVAAASEPEQSVGASDTCGEFE